MKQVRLAALSLVVSLSVATAALAQATVEYRMTFNDRAHRLMDVEITFPEVSLGPLELRMSRSSPGRYALHEFAKNVFGVRVTDGAGRPLTVDRPNPHQWDVAGHDGTVRVAYRVFGDRIDGTYLGIDSTHAHINMPAALMYAPELERRPAIVRFVVPPGSSWRVATQLIPAADPFTFSAPNLQYLMDSPVEVSAFAMRVFTVPDEMRTPVFRVAVHHQGTDADVDAFVRDIEAIVREARYVFGEYPVFEGNTYTFIADYLPWASGDGMEHRNSTILTSAGSLSTLRAGLLETVSHEFFHAWNVERIRPRSLEPFRFDEANMSGELWLAEGFTSYYGPLIMARAGVSGMRDVAAAMERAINTVRTSPAPGLRSAEEMSRLAPFVDAASPIDRTSFENTFVSYYTWGSAIGLGLDLTLRARSDSRVTLDDFMRLLWVRHGKPGGRHTGYVDAPYTVDDLKDALATVSGDRAFADDFFARYIQGHEIVDYAPLLARAGLLLRPASPARATWGSVRTEETPDGVRLVSSTPFGSPLYNAGLDRDDTVVTLDGARVTTMADVQRIVGSRMPGDRLAVSYLRRGQQVSETLTLIQDPRYDIVLAEEVGEPLTDAQRAFRMRWLGSVARNTF